MHSRSRLIRYFGIAALLCGVVILLFSQCRQRAVSENRDEKAEANQLIIVDLWEPWCIPCIANFSKFLQLQERWKTKATFLLYTTSTDREKVYALLDRHSVPRSMNIIDTTAYLNRKESVEFLPYTIIFNKDKSKVLWKGSTHALNDKLLEKLVTGKTLTDAPASRESEIIVADTTDIYSLRIALNKDQSFREDWGDRLSSKYNGIYYKAEGWSLFNLISVQLLGFSPARVVLQDGVKDLYIDLEFEYRGAGKELGSKELLKDELCYYFSLQVDTLYKAQQVYVVAAGDPCEARDGDKRQWAYIDNEVHFSGQDLEGMAEMLEMIYEVPVISDASDACLFSGSFKAEYDLQETLQKLKDIGLASRMEYRNLESLSISKAN